MSTRKFYKTTIVIEVLSEGTIPECTSLADIEHEFTQGNYSATVRFTDRKELNEKQAALELMKQGSTPDFFMLDEDED